MNALKMLLLLVIGNEKRKKLIVIEIYVVIDFRLPFFMQVKRKQSIMFMATINFNCFNIETNIVPIRNSTFLVDSHCLKIWRSFGILFFMDIFLFWFSQFLFLFCGWSHVKHNFFSSFSEICVFFFKSCSQ